MKEKFCGEEKKISRKFGRVQNYRFEKILAYCYISLDVSGSTFLIAYRQKSVLYEYRKQ
jgi:hypothetical protein